MVVFRDDCQRANDCTKWHGTKDELRFINQLNVWNREKEQKRFKKLQEQREVREMLNKHWPWGKEIKSRGIGNLRLEEIFPNDELLKSKRLTGTLHMGKPGGGAPHRIRTVEDPQLRFQFSKDLKRTVENTLRYKKKRKEQEEYKSQLDKIVTERRKLKAIEKKDNLKQEKYLLSLPSPWGKPGPGGILWRQPKDIGLNFLQSMGWSDETTLNNLDSDFKTYKDKVGKQNENMKRLPCENVGKYNRNLLNIKPYRLSPLLPGKGDGDLVDVIAKKRYHPNISLSTTDVTGDKRNLSYYMKLHDENKLHLQVLSMQMNEKLDNVKRMKEDELLTSRRHFATWDGFWGRPGHGARCSNTKKGNLDKMLFPQMMPIGAA